jgi:hypothetical protein
MYEKARSIVQTNERLTDDFLLLQVFSKDASSHPLFFCLFLNSLLALVPNNTGIDLGGYLFNLLAYADDTSLLNGKIEELQASANAIDETASSFVMMINANKTKVIRVSQQAETGTTTPPPSPKSL